MQCLLVMAIPLSLPLASSWMIGIADILMILAILLAPLVAVHVQRKLDKESERRQEKLRLFASLMATRHTSDRTSPRHVESLNLIDIVFGGRGQSNLDKDVIDAWRVYLDALDFGTDNAVKSAKMLVSDDKFVELLFSMGRAVGYPFEIGRASCRERV